MPGLRLPNRITSSVIVIKCFARTVGRRLKHGEWGSKETLFGILARWFLSPSPLGGKDGEGEGGGKRFNLRDSNLFLASAVHASS